MRPSSLEAESDALYEIIISEVRSFSGYSSTSSRVRDFHYACAPHVPPDMRKRWQKFRASKQQYQDLSADFLGHFDNAIVPDDKRKKIAWILNLFLMCSFAWMASTWTRHNMSPAEANAWLCKLLLALLGDELAKKLRISADTDSLPYMYVTIKQKCWSGNMRVKNCELQHVASQSIMEVYTSSVGYNLETLWKYMRCVELTRCLNETAE